MTTSASPAAPQASAFPPAPWRLNGHGLQALFLVPLKRARELVPPPLRARAVVPGYTLGVISAGHYDATGTLAYDELIVSPAFVTNGERSGLFISHIYVDSEASQAGGQRIWNLDKQLARFEWTRDRLGLTVTTAREPLCQLRHTPILPLWMPRIALPAFSVRGSRCTFFRGVFRSRPRLGLVRCSIDRASPLADVVPDERLLGCGHDRASMIADAPILEIALQAGSRQGRPAP